LEISLINAFEIFNRTTGKVLPGKSMFGLLDFRMEVSEQLIGGYRGKKEDSLFNMHWTLHKHLPS
jgi:hypothetical protein